LKAPKTTFIAEMFLITYPTPIFILILITCVVSKKISKKSLCDNYFKNEITSKHWLLPRLPPPPPLLHIMGTFTNKRARGTP
jgi:hypothetical protein